MIANHLSRLLGERRLSIMDVSRQSSVSYSSLHDFYHDRTSLYARDTLDRLCQALGVGVGDILEHVPDQTDREGSADG